MNKSNKPRAAIALRYLLVLSDVILGIILAWPIQWLWNNSLVGAVDSVHLISFWQAYGIFLLVNLVLTTNKP